MDINATVLVQAFNFGITYLFLRTLLLKPIMQRIQRKEGARKNLVTSIRNRECKALGLQEEKKQDLEVFRTHLREAYIKPVRPEMEPIADVTGIKVFDADAIKTMIEQSKKLLIKELPHAF